MIIFANFTTFVYFLQSVNFVNFLIHIKKTSANIMEKMILKIGGRDIVLEILQKLK